jgi:hypothetical protein
MNNHADFYNICDNYTLSPPMLKLLDCIISANGTCFSLDLIRLDWLSQK